VNTCQHFWPVGEKVTVTADLNGWNAGNDMWGAGTTRAQEALPPEQRGTVQDG